MFARASTSTRLRKQVILPLLSTLLIAYFGYYTFFGDRSLIRLMQLEAQVQTTQTKLASAKAEHDGYQERVKRLRPESLDADLLDEQSRRVLNYTAPDEIVIYSKTSSGKAD